MRPSKSLPSSSRLGSRKPEIRRLSRVFFFSLSLFMAMWGSFLVYLWGRFCLSSLDFVFSKERFGLFWIFLVIYFLFIIG